MKKILATVLIIGSTVVLGACANNGDAGNAHGRTAGYEAQDTTYKAPARAERTFTRAQVK